MWEDGGGAGWDEQGKGEEILIDYFLNPESFFSAQIKAR
jgi:hypothetical protein